MYSWVYFSSSSSGSGQEYNKYDNHPHQDKPSHNPEKNTEKVKFIIATKHWNISWIIITIISSWVVQ